jgi:hypothetical protein
MASSARGGGSSAKGAPSIEADREDIARLQKLLSTSTLSNDLHTCSQDAPWRSFRHDRAIHAALATPIQDDFAKATEWIRTFESAVHELVIRRAFLDYPPDEAAARCAAYRSLGRGWFMVQLMVNQKKFKFWFENIERIERNRLGELDRLNLGETLTHFLRGFVCHCEVVFMIRGIVHPENSRTSVPPSVSIKKWDPSYHLKEVWSSNEWLQKQMNTPVPTDEERMQHAATTERNRRKREKQKQKKKVAAAAAAEQAASEPTTKDPHWAESEEHQRFERLLAEMSADSPS